MFCTVNFIVVQPLSICSYYDLLNVDNCANISACLLVFLFWQGVYILQKNHFFPCSKFFFLPSSFFPARKGKNGKIVTELLILFILSPSCKGILLVFYTKEGRKMEKNVFSSPNFYIFPPTTYFFIFVSILQNIHPWQQPYPFSATARD